ncbi:MAG: rod shape-determining protein MreC [Planctomycetota bacterium]|jgi:cell shape-determining protein MreC
MARKLKKVSARMLFTWFLLAGLILLFTPQNLTNKFQFVFARFFHWPLSLGRSASLSATRSVISDTSDEEAYIHHITNLEIWLERERRKVEELSRLRERLPLQNARLMVADVTAASDGSQSEFFINRGEDDGLARGQFVLGQNSVIGTISDISSHSAQVKLVTDPESRIAVEIGRLGLRRVMRGGGSGSAKIEMVSTKHELKTGDKVFAAPQVGLLDDPVIVGEITRCRMDDENPSLWDITVQPVCNLDRLYDVAVIVMNARP